MLCFSDIARLECVKICIFCVGAVLTWGKSQRFPGFDGIFYVFTKFY